MHVGSSYRLPRTARRGSKRPKVLSGPESAVSWIQTERTRNGKEHYLPLV
jgi:hypothetical protein